MTFALLLSLSLAAQPELTDPGPLLDARGQLVQEGWARSPLLAYERDAARGHLKEWDNFNIWTTDHSLAVTIADVGRVGLVSVTWRDLSTGQVITAREWVPLPRLGLPATPETGNVHFTGGRMGLAILHHDEGRRRIQVTVPAFDGTRALSADLWLTWPELSESIVLAHPWAEGPEFFTYSVKQLPLEARGTVRLGDEEILFAPQQSFGVMDWGRSVRPREGTWQWGFGVQGTIGWNLGGQGPASGGIWTQNMVMVDGVAHPFGPVTWTFDKASPGDSWTVRSEDGRLDLTLTPRHAHVEQRDLKVVSTDIVQAFGTWAGTITLEDGQVLAITDAPGLAEEVSNRW